MITADQRTAMNDEILHAGQQAGVNLPFKAVSSIFARHIGHEDSGLSISSVFVGSMSLVLALPGRKKRDYEKRKRQIFFSFSSLTVN